jgi:hypothetical protein
LLERLNVFKVLLYIGNMASPRRFERPPCRLGGGCSIQLSYRDERKLLIIRGLILV